MAVEPELIYVCVPDAWKHGRPKCRSVVPHPHDPRMPRVLHQGPEITCPLVPMKDNRHVVRCEDCECAEVCRLTLGQADDWYRQAWISQEQYEAYRHAWALLAPSRPTDGWAVVPADPDVRRVLGKLLSLQGRRLAEFTAEVLAA